MYPIRKKLCYLISYSLLVNIRSQWFKWTYSIMLFFCIKFLFLEKKLFTSFLYILYSKSHISYFPPKRLFSKILKMKVECNDSKTFLWNSFIFYLLFHNAGRFTSQEKETRLSKRVFMNSQFILKCCLVSCFECLLEGLHWKTSYSRWPCK